MNSTVKESLKEPREGSEREPETLCLQTVEESNLNRVLFVERSGELCVVARLKTKRSGAEAKASVNSATSRYA